MCGKGVLKSEGMTLNNAMPSPQEANIMAIYDYAV